MIAVVADVALVVVDVRTSVCELRARPSTHVCELWMKRTQEQTTAGPTTKTETADNNANHNAASQNTNNNNADSNITYNSKAHSNIKTSNIHHIHI